MDLLSGLQIQIDMLWYNILFSFASLHWGILRAFIMMGYSVELLNDWLVQSAFGPLIGLANDSLRVAVSVAFVIAMLILGITYLLAVFVRLNVVEPRSALTWYAAGLLFFSIGPSLYQGMSDFRRNIAEGFYLSTLQGLENNMGDVFSPLQSVDTSDLGLIQLCDNLGTYLPGVTAPGAIDGLDVALAYLRADGVDVMGYLPPVPDIRCQPHLPDPETGAWTAGAIPWEWNWRGSYFDDEKVGQFFEVITDEERAQSIAMATAAHGRLLTAWPLVLFGVVEQLVYLLLTIAQGLTFISLSMAILFAFFKKTEVIAQSIINLWIELIVQTVAIALVQSLVVAFFLAGTTSGNGMVVLGIGLICLVFMVIVLWSGVKAVWNSFNRLFGAMGQATGGAVIPVGAGAAATTALMGTGVSMSANMLAGLHALKTGGTLAQAAGITFGGSDTLSGAARTLAYLPGLRGTSLGDAAEQFTEGAVTRQVARHIPVVGGITGPMLGTQLLTDRDPEAANYDQNGYLVRRPMLVPAVGDGLERWTVPGDKHRWSSVHRESGWIEGEEGELYPASGSPRRMGTFTPIAIHATDSLAGQLGRSEHAAEMQGEEMEQHISDQMRANKTAGQSPDWSRFEQVMARFEQGAEALIRAAREQTMVGNLRVSGGQDVASVMGDVIGVTQSARTAQSQDIGAGIDHASVANTMAQVMGVTPLVNDTSPVTDDLARFGMFADQALRLGISGQQTEQVVREVKASPEGHMEDTTRTLLVEQARTDRNLSWDTANTEVDRLEHYARILPNEINAFGALSIPVVVDIDVKSDATALHSEVGK